MPTSSKSRQKTVRPGKPEAARSGESLTRPQPEPTLTPMTSTDSTSGVAAVNQPFIKPVTGAGPRLWRWTLRLVGQVRRQLLSRLRPGYIARMREQRLGKCRCCGSCCDLTFHCPYLNAEHSCTHYEKRQITCRDFPHDARDLRLTRVPCGHYFAPPPGGEPRAHSAD
jgi:hypothetical protein